MLNVFNGVVNILKTYRNILGIEKLQRLRYNSLRLKNSSGSIDDKMERLGGEGFVTNFHVSIDFQALK